MKNWLSMNSWTPSSSSTSTAVVSDLNIEVKIVSRLWYTATVVCGVPGLGAGLTCVDKSHERVELMVRYLVGNSGLCGRRREGTEGL